MSDQRACERLRHAVVAESVDDIPRCLRILFEWAMAQTFAPANIEFKVRREPFGGFGVGVSITKQLQT